MTKRSRTVLFLICLFLFLLIAPLAVFYSQGYRFDFNSKKITQTGAFYFKVWPKSVEIYVNGKLKKKTDLFFGSVHIENLLPKKYTVEIKKKGYFPWQKALEIKEKLVTAVKNIVLIPEKPEFTTLAKNVEGFFFSPDEKKIILKESEEKNWALKLYDLGGEIKSSLIGEKEISNKGAELFGLKFSPDSKKVLLEVGVGEELRYYILEIDKTPSVLNLLDFLGKDIEDIFFNPKDPQKLFVVKTGSLSEVDLNKKEISLPLSRDILALTIFTNNIYYLDTAGFVSKTDFSFSSIQRINENPLSVKKETSYQIKVFPPYFFLKEGGALYFFDEATRAFKKLLEPVNDFKLSPNFKKMVYFNDSEIWILFLETIYEQPQKQTGEQLFLTRFAEKIGEVFWYTSDYLVFNTGDKIKIAEIDERDRINIVDLDELKNPKIFWNEYTKKLYILSSENLSESEKLIQ